jgi:hypothetical protein
VSGIALTALLHRRGEFTCAVKVPLLTKPAFVSPLVSLSPVRTRPYRLCHQTAPEEILVGEDAAVVLVKNIFGRDQPD